MNGFSIRTKIYTRQGDRGQTRLLSGETVEKDDPRLKAYGALDELQGHLGVARSVAKSPLVIDVVRSLQEDIFTASSELSCTPETTPSRLKRRIGAEDVERVEGWIDEMTDTYGLPKRFIAPGECLESAALHVARSVCRRCERILVSLNRMVEGYAQLLAYFNRMSDLLFVLAWAVDVMETIEHVLDDMMLST